MDRRGCRKGRKGSLHRHTGGHTCAGDPPFFDVLVEIDGSCANLWVGILWVYLSSLSMLLLLTL